MRDTSPSFLAESWLAFQEAFLLRSVSEQISGIRAGISANYLCGLAETLNVPHATIFRLVGISHSAARRCIALNRTLTPSASERLLRIGSIEKRTVAVFGTAELAHEWLRTRNVSLWNVSPLSLLDTEHGAKEVARILNAIEHGGAA